MTIYHHLHCLSLGLTSFFLVWIIVVAFYLVFMLLFLSNFVSTARVNLCKNIKSYVTSLLKGIQHLFISQNKSLNLYCGLQDFIWSSPSTLTLWPKFRPLCHYLLLLLTLTCSLFVSHCFPSYEPCLSYLVILFPKCLHYLLLIYF